MRIFCHAALYVLYLVCALGFILPFSPAESEDIWFTALDAQFVIYLIENKV